MRWRTESIAAMFSSFSHFFPMPAVTHGTIEKHIRDTYEGEKFLIIDTKLASNFDNCEAVFVLNTWISVY